MNAIFNLLSLHTFKHIIAATSIFTTLSLANNAFATVINFDDLSPAFDPEEPCWCDNPLTDQYLSKGVLISGSWVIGSDSHNVMLTSDFGLIQFAGELPIYVSMNVTSQYGDAIIFDVYGTSGLLESKHTSGWFGDDSTPAIPDEFIFFDLTNAISYIEINGYYNARVGAAIDNLTFISVPEPSSIILIIIGLSTIVWHRCKIKPG